MTIRSFTIPRTAHLASTALPAAGAFTSQSFSALRVGAKTLTFFVSYTRGSGTGKPKFKFEWSNGTDTAEDLIQDDGSLTVADPTGTVNDYLYRPLGPTPADGNPLVYIVQVDQIPWGATSVRLAVAEEGDTDNPGTVSIYFTGGIAAP